MHAILVSNNKRHGQKPKRQIVLLSHIRQVKNIHNRKLSLQAESCTAKTCKAQGINIEMAIKSTLVQPELFYFMTRAAK